MAERKTGVFPLNYLTEEDTELFTDSEIVELIIKTFNYLRSGEEPTFSKRLMKVRFMDHKEFFDRNMESYAKKLNNLNHVKDSLESSRIVSNRDQVEHVYVNDNENVIKRKTYKKKNLSNIQEHDYGDIHVVDPRRKKDI